MTDWQHPSTAPNDGTVCELQFRDNLGTYTSPGSTYFLHDDGNWYLIDPPTLVQAPVHRWRPVMETES